MLKPISKIGWIVLRREGLKDDMKDKLKLLFEEVAVGLLKVNTKSLICKSFDYVENSSYKISS